MSTYVLHTYLAIIEIYRRYKLQRHNMPKCIIYTLLLSSLHNQNLTGFVFYTDICDIIIA